MRNTIYFVQSYLLLPTYLSGSSILGSIPTTVRSPDSVSPLSRVVVATQVYTPAVMHHVKTNIYSVTLLAFRCDNNCG